MSAPNSSYTKFQRVMAMLGVILLLALTVCSLLFRFITFPGSDRLAWACLVAAIFMPILIWIWIWCYGQFRRKETIATVFPDRGDDSVSDKTDAAAQNDPESSTDAKQ